jgi:SRSO17 transposase
MSLLESPKAQALLAEAVVEPTAVRSCVRGLSSFLVRYLPLFYRKEQAANASITIKGLLSNLQRKTCEPIARRQGVTRKPIQFFVGSGRWNDEAVMAEMRQQIVEERGNARGILVFDGTSFVKKGKASCGVKRQWCGRLGKIENCQAGLFLAYATPEGYAPLDRRLFLPEEWCQDRVRRKKTHVPRQVVFRKKWEMALDMLDRHGAQVPHAWVAGDDEFGRSADFRAGLRERKEGYVLDVPRDTLVRDLERKPPRGRRVWPLERAEEWLKRQPARRWEEFTVAAGEKGPLHVRAMRVGVRAMHGKQIGPPEILVVLRTVDAEPQTRFGLSNAGPEVPLAELVRVLAQRHKIEELFEAAKGEVGLAHYEVRSWTGWHHHMTLALLALWFVIRQRQRLGGKNPGADGTGNAQPLLTPAA